jgi:NADPH:quinone reductase-like Zn-dependent oxidoreductase
MRAIVIQKFGGPENLVIKELPDPEPKPGHVVIQVKAFGINHAEMHMRRREWAEAAEVSGIDCVGLVKSCPDGELAVATKVAALMGGIRGAMSSFGQAALNMAVNAGAHVIATSRNPDRFQKLEALGARRVEIEGPDLSERIPEQKRIDAVLDLVGNSTILDSLGMLRRGGRACLADFLGGLAPVPDFNPLLQMSSGVHFSFFVSFVFGKPGFPCQMSRSRPSSNKWPPVAIKQNQRASSVLRIFGKRTE